MEEMGRVEAMGCCLQPIKPLSSKDGFWARVCIGPEHDRAPVARDPVRV